MKSYNNEAVKKDEIILEKNISVTVEELLKTKEALEKEIEALKEELNLSYLACSTLKTEIDFYKNNSVMVRLKFHYEDKVPGQSIMVSQKEAIKLKRDGLIE